jgi:hypothetical protein
VETASTRFAGHTDHVIGDKWARALADKLRVRAVVICGIHYDELSADGINEIVRLSDKMLGELLSLLRR